MIAHKPMDDVTVPHIAKGRRAERLVAEHFEQHGARKVEIGNGARGADIVVTTRDGITYAVEVKAATKQPVGNSWLVHKVSDLRKNDNWIAIVLPDDSIVFETMQEHLAKCAPNGRRTVTDLVKRSQKGAA